MDIDITGLPYVRPVEFNLNLYDNSLKGSF